MAKSNTQLVNFRFDPEAINELDGLQKTVKASSRAEVIRRALTLLKMATDVSDEGGRLYIEDAEGHQKEIVIL